MNRLLEVVENAEGDVDRAADAERRVIEELRQLGQEALQGWAERRQEVVVASEGKKTLLAQLLRSNLGSRADVSLWSWWQANAPVRSGSRYSLSRVFATFAAGPDRLRCGGVVWQSGRAVAGTLWD